MPRRCPVERDIDRYLLVIAAIYERTMQHGTTQRLVDNLRRAVAALDGHARRDALRVGCPGRDRGLDVLLADDEIAEADAILERVAPSVSRLRGSTPVLQSELEHRRVMSALAKGDFDDVLATIALFEQRTARTEMSRFAGGHRFDPRVDRPAAGRLRSGR